MADIYFGLVSRDPTAETPTYTPMVLFETTEGDWRTATRRIVDIDTVRVLRRVGAGSWDTYEDREAPTPDGAGPGVFHVVYAGEQVIAIHCFKNGGDDWYTVPDSVRLTSAEIDEVLAVLTVP